MRKPSEYMQLCWVVADLEAAVAHWVRTAGAGPFFLFDEVHFTESNYRGTPADIAPHRAAIGQMGATQIELVQPIGNQSGVWGDVPGAGLHHAGLYCDDYEGQRAAYLAAGADVVFEGLMMGAPTCYLDTVASLGFMTELITANPIADQVFAAFKAAAEGWDDSEPIRRLG